MRNEPHTITVVVILGDFSTGVTSGKQSVDNDIDATNNILKPERHLGSDKQYMVDNAQ